jgi:hypothetical protein
MPPYQLPCPFFTIREQLYYLPIDIDPSVLGKIFKDILTGLESTILNNLVQSQISILSQRPDDLKEFVLFLDLRQHAQRGMACFSLQGVHSFMF